MRNENTDKLFRAGSNFKENAVMNYSKGEPHRFVEGYREAADTLVDHVLSTQFSQDTLICPIVFLYRHHLELQLKVIISLGKQLNGEDKSYPQGHNLCKLWGESQEIIQKYFSDEDNTSYFNNTSQVLNELHQVDPGSCEFRYWESTNGLPTLKSLKLVNIRDLSDHIKKVSDDLGGTAMALENNLENKKEMESDYYDYQV